MKLLICNWKENKTLSDCLKDKKIIEQCDLSNIKLVLCPSYPYLPVLHSRKYYLGAQDVSEYANGSYTGEVSAEMLKSLDVKYVIIGHHEREMYFLENSDKQKKKIKNALDQDLKIIIPVGETLMEYQLDKTEEVIAKKLNDLLTDIPENKKKNIALAYEPIWRVGKSCPINKKEIMKVIIFIKQWLYDHQFPNNPVLYGGGLQLEDFDKLPEIDGFLIGNLSLNVENLCKVIAKFQNSTHVYKS
ncbi:MAG: triosephosphate isomerase [Bacilli bacterium]|nr:triosephosphate isomerase [Bacilli bacterium]